jgi:uncharacterized protein (TIGR00645 family)
MRWLLAPLCIGLVAALLLVVAQFFRDLANAVLGFPDLTGTQVILTVLKLIDLVLVCYLTLMIIGAGVTSFAPEAAQDPRRPRWMTVGDFGRLKLRIIGSVIAIAAIDLLETAVRISEADKGDVMWEIAILLTFVICGVLLAFMDWLTERTE